MGGIIRKPGGGPGAVRYWQFNMTKHCFIDESGTMDHQGLMSVALITLEGVNSAQRLHDQIMTALAPGYLARVKQLKKERKSTHLPQLHYADMSSEQKRTVGARLGQAKITVYSAHHFHADEKTYDERFAIYTELVKICVQKALSEHTELVISIAKQGGWQKYENDFCAVLRNIAEEFCRAGDYRRATFQLLSAVKPGIQLADFYVGTVRDFVANEPALMPYDLVQEQILCREIYVLATMKSKK